LAGPVIFKGKNIVAATGDNPLDMLGSAQGFTGRGCGNRRTGGGQIIDGEAEVVIENRCSKLVTGQGILIPSHAANVIRASERAKILRTVFKSGYEGITV
jgi:hypothetical protein